jgi:hypothetical protein
LCAKFHIPKATKCNFEGAIAQSARVAVFILGKKRRFRKDVAMLYPMIGARTCSLCNGTYESDAKLREHQRMAHRGRGNEERPQAAVVVEQSENAGD